MQKICILTTSLAIGGAERFSANLSDLLAKLCFEVHILITKDKIDYNYTGKLFNLEKEAKYSENLFLKIKLLKTYFKNQNFDYIIDNRIRNYFFKDIFLYKGSSCNLCLPGPFHWLFQTFPHLHSIR